ncbi:hypothetical protein J5N97_026207 [Dioscorea zingiberensis]|uniref:Uncharacterized protein n=1 Tax=Dioscorea zingiberensis TaxID=325984 RepID=A0A9D5C289_9LILI|nr:hypothetical protein J5N97_026207 [Dioscorea zingiberensis]
MAMAQLGRFRKQCPFSLVDIIPLKNQRRLSKASSFSSFVDHWCIKNQAFHKYRVLQDKHSSFTTWASHIGSRNQLELSKNHYLCNTGSLFEEKIFSLVGVRGFCTNESKEDSKIAHKNILALVEGQAAFLDYLHGTRGLQFTDAENISKNSPIFLGRLLKKVENEEEIGRALMRYFRYHPINEFEPFFESLGLKPSEYNPFLPRELMFLADDVTLLSRTTMLYVTMELLMERSLLVGEIDREFVKLLEQLESIVSSSFGALWSSNSNIDQKAC